MIIVTNIPEESRSTADASMNRNDDKYKDMQGRT